MTGSALRRGRLGIFFEIPFRRDEGGFSTHVPFIRFVLALRPHLDGLVLIGRVDPKPGREHYAVPDDVWVIGPVPTSIPVAVLGLARKKRLVLGVRRNLPVYVRHRLGGKRWAPTLGAAYVLEALFRLLARRIPTVAVGADLTRLYSGGRAPVLELTVSLVSEADVHSLSSGAHHPGTGHPGEF